MTIDSIIGISSSILYPTWLAYLEGNIQYWKQWHGSGIVSKAAAVGYIQGRSALNSYPWYKCWILYTEMQY